VYVPDASFSVQAVEAIIRYCYQGYIDEELLTEEKAESILELAHYYDMSSLKKVLEAYLAKSLDSENVVRKAKLADECSAEKLKTACVSCIAANKSVFKSSEWGVLLKERVDLAVGLLTRVMFPDDESPALEYPSRKDTVEKRNWNIFGLICESDADIHDCLFKVGEETFKCHKCFLMAHSPVLREMLTCSMAVEAETGVVHEKLFPVPIAVYGLIVYCYCYCYDGDMTGMVVDETVVTVFKLADKYLMDELKSAMEKRLVENLSIANVVEMAVLADTHSVQDLRKACVELIAREKSVIESAEWVKLQKENLNLVAELLVDALREKFA